MTFHGFFFFFFALETRKCCVTSSILTSAIFLIVPFYQWKKKIHFTAVTYLIVCTKWSRQTKQLQLISMSAIWSFLVLHQWRNGRQGYWFSIPRAGICYWYGDTWRCWVTCDMVAFLSPISWRWRTILEPVDCNRLCCLLVQMEEENGVRYE